jgi:hypothetical protein
MSLSSSLVVAMIPTTTAALSFFLSLLIQITFFSKTNAEKVATSAASCCSHYITFSISTSPSSESVFSLSCSWTVLPGIHIHQLLSRSLILVHFA